MLNFALLFFVTTVLFLALFLWQILQPRTITTAQNQQAITISPDIQGVEVTHPPIVECTQQTELRSESLWDEYWLKFGFGKRLPVELRPVPDQSETRIKCTHLFVISVYFDTERQREVLQDNFRQIRTLHPENETVVCVITNKCPLPFTEHLDNVVYLDNTTWVNKNFRYELSGYATALDLYDPEWVVCMQGSLLLQKRVDFASLANRQPDSAKQMFAIKYFDGLFVGDAEDPEYIWSASQSFGGVPKDQSMCNGVFGCNFIAGGKMIESLRASVLRLKVDTKNRSMGMERVLGIFMWNHGIDPKDQNVDGNLSEQYAAERPAHFFFWKVFFTQFK